MFPHTSGYYGIKPPISPSEEFGWRSREGLLSTLRSASVRWLLHKHEMKCSLLVPPALENPNVIELNYFLPSFHVEPHIYIRGKKLIFRASLYCFPINLHALQLPVCAVIDSSASLPEIEEEKSLWLPLRCFVVCVSAAGCSVHARCVCMCDSAILMTVMSASSPISVSLACDWREQVIDGSCCLRLYACTYSHYTHLCMIGV